MPVVPNELLLKSGCISTGARLIQNDHFVVAPAVLPVFPCPSFRPVGDANAERTGLVTVVGNCLLQAGGQFGWPPGLYSVDYTHH